MVSIYNTDQSFYNTYLPIHIFSHAMRIMLRQKNENKNSFSIFIEFAEMLRNLLEVIP